ncbi:MAG TPA: lytic transglycosylase, partial [Pseudolabrys sp.]
TRPLYQARIGANSRQAANDMCRRIQRAGAACIVTRNRG